MRVLVYTLMIWGLFAERSEISQRSSTMNPFTEQKPRCNPRRKNKKKPALQFIEHELLEVLPHPSELGLPCLDLPQGSGFWVGGGGTSGSVKPSRGERELGGQGMQGLEVWGLEVWGFCGGGVRATATPGLSGLCG